ncbi:YceI family protein [Gracilimonas sp. BCB1]|uniref:YceI family protein n=1 Tax=Gracilimonas sp. BCB1 TaxID=3152362 RepID=UPI0032D8D631
MLKTTFSILITLLLSTTLFAQTYQIVPAESEIIVWGTSNVHDWEAPAEEYSGSANIKVSGDSLISISNLQFTVVAEEINSGKGGMDKRIDDALKVKKHPNITFSLTEIQSIGSSSITANGELTIAGVTKNVQMEVEYQLQPDGSILISGKQNIDMTEFNVDPPTAMFGSIKAGAKVDVEFNAKFSQ